MSSGLLVGLELALVLGVVLALAVWDLLRLRRKQARDASTCRGDAAPRPPPPADDQA